MSDTLRVRTAAACGCMLLAASCMVGPDYAAPRQATPGGYAQAASATRPSNATADAEPVVRWWTTLHDPELDRLVRRAAAGNLDLQLAASRLVEARAALRIAGTGELPTLDATGSFARLNSGSNLGLPGLANGQSTAINTNLWVAGFDASWEVDVFGGQRRKIEAAGGDFQAGVEDRRDVLVSVTAEVARDYLGLRGLQGRLRIARQNLALQAQTLALTETVRAAGMDSRLDVSRARTEVAQTRAGIVPLVTAVTLDQHAIALLLGLTPNELSAELGPAAPLPAVPPRVGVGMPADLIRRRPDVRRAERQVAAANARVGAVIADFYPKFSLTGDFGLDAEKFDRLFNGESRYFLLNPSVDWRVFDFGRISAEVDQEKARHQQAILTYRKAVLSALRDVEDALAAYGDEQDRRAALVEAVSAATEAVSLSTDLYKQGFIDFLQLLDAQRQLLSAQDALAQSDQAVGTNLVALYKALGGGWEDEAAGPRSDLQPHAGVPPTTAAERQGSGQRDPQPAP